MDAFRHNAGKQSAADGIETVYYDIAQMPDYDIIFITNPTELHLASLKKFQDKGKHFFIEKPVVSRNQIEEAKHFCLKEGAVYYVACPLRYNAVIQYTKKSINVDDVISVRSISSSYLPDWRPGQDYRETYSAHNSLGGGVSIDLIHEWDYLTAFFGMPNKSFSIQEKISALEIDSDDIAIYIAQTDTTTIELHLDYFGRKPIRTLELFMPYDTIHCDILNGHIEYLKSGKQFDFNSERNVSQMLEIEHFFDIINNKITNDNTLEHSLNVLKLAKS